MAVARSESLNHLLAIIICELRKIEATLAIKNVPSTTGQKL